MKAYLHEANFSPIFSSLN